MSASGGDSDIQLRSAWLHFWRVRYGFGVSTSLNVMQETFGHARALIGMVHVRALPGAPRASLDLNEIEQIAAHEAQVLRDAGFTGAIIENMHDRPYQTNVGHEVVACMTRIGLAVRDAAPELTLGVQILSLSARQTMATAFAVGAAFVRIENMTHAHVADEGLMSTAEAGDLLRYRRQLGADTIRVFADIKKKHASHAMTSDLSLTDAAKAAEFFLADGLIVTGSATGEPTDVADVQEARSASSLPIVVGSGVTPDTIPLLLEHADGVIVGSSLKEGGSWSEPIDAARCRSLAKAFHSS